MATWSGRICTATASGATLCGGRRRFDHNTQEFHQEERAPFTGLAVVPGARIGQNVTIRPQLLRVDKFLANGIQVRQRVILSVFVKVTETCEVNVAQDTTGPLVICNRVVAQACRQVLSEGVAELAVPAQKVHEIQARVSGMSCEVISNKVIVTGAIHKQIFFVGPDDVVHHQAEDIPFTTFVELPGAEPHMGCQISGAVEHISWHLLEPVDSAARTLALSDPYLEEEGCPLFSRLAQRTVIQVCVAVAEEQQIHVRAIPVGQVGCQTVCQTVCQ